MLLKSTAKWFKIKELKESLVYENSYFNFELRYYSLTSEKTSYPDYIISRYVINYYENILHKQNYSELCNSSYTLWVDMYQIALFNLWGSYVLISFSCIYSKKKNSEHCKNLILLLFTLCCIYLLFYSL